MRTKTTQSCSGCLLVRDSDPRRSAVQRRAFLTTSFSAILVGGTVLGETPGARPLVIRMISRERLLRDVEVARQLRRAEQRMTERLQAQIDETRVALAAEEAELAEVRETLPVDELDRRIQDFDRRMRLARQITQERAASLQKGFQDARAAVVAGLPALIERLRQEVGADVILNADQVLAADPALDLTDRAVSLFDEAGPRPPIPDIDLTLPVRELVAPEADDG
ncbi:MAG: OmpH family outer membrane protein [Pseudomonadota bacterium]